MTEAEWLACEKPLPMLEFRHDRASVRKLRLFACACCRRIWHLLLDKRAQDAVEMAERFADRLVEDSERSAARKLALQATEVRGVTPRPEAPKWARRAAAAAYWASARDIMDAVRIAIQLAEESLIWQAGGYTFYDRQTIENEHSAQARVLRDILGNPFHSITITSAWLQWNDGIIPQLAQQIYDERAFDRLPILADALEEAGCTHADILNHCRQSGEHVRGCWVVDLILGKS